MILQDGETLKSHDIVVVLYTHGDDFHTNYIYNNNITDEEILKFLAYNLSSRKSINILHIWR